MFRDTIIDFIRRDCDAACRPHEHPLLYRHAESLVSKGHTPEAVADEVARLFDLSDAHKAAVRSILDEHAAEVARNRKPNPKTVIRLMETAR